MAGTFLGKYDTTAANNTATGTGSVSVAEGMLPSNINNAFRDIMADIRQHYNVAEWIEYGDGAGTYTATYASSTSFTIDGANVTSIYHAGRRVKVTASTPGTIYGTVSSTSFSTNTTVNVTWDSGSLSSEAITSVYIGVLAKTNSSIPTGVIGTTNIVADAVTNAKIADDQIDSEHYVDGSIDLAHLAADSVNGTKIADNAIDSEHYTDGSIDTAHIADVNVTLAKLAASSVNSSKIVDDSIVNADINSSAAIDATKIADGTVTSAEFQYINTLSSNAQTQINAKAATTYVDDAVAGLRTRIIAECASTANVTISSALEAGDTIDGITLVAGDRVLLKDQSTASENGLYTAVGSGAGAASRDTQFNSISELSGQMVVVNQGSANDNKIFLCTTNNTASLGSDSITFTVITPSNTGTVTSVTAGTGLSGGAITSTGTIAIDSTVATLTGTQTLTNKTLTAPTITATSTTVGGKIKFLEGTDNGTNGVTLVGAASTADVDLILPAAADTLVGKATTDTLTNKTFDLGGTGNSLTGSLGEFNTALQSESFVGLAATQTLTNKTLTSPKINEDVVCSATATELNLVNGCTATTTELNYLDLTTLGTSAASKVLSADANNLTKISGGIYIEEATLTFDVTQDWDVRTSPVAKVVLTNNVTFDAPTNPTTGQFISIVCIQDGTGSRTVAWNAVFEFASDTAPTATTTASLGDMFNFRYNGAKWLEVGRNLALTLA